MTLKEIKERQAAREWADVEAIARAIAPKARENARLRREKERRDARRIQAEMEYLSRTGTVLKVFSHAL